MRTTLLALLVIVGCGQSAEPDATPKGATIAEPAGGRWVHLCSVVIDGPARPPLLTAARATASRSEDARREATRKACEALKGGEACQKQQQGWSLEAPEGACTVTKRSPTQEEHDCAVLVRKAPESRHVERQSEARSAEIACRKARDEACAAVEGGLPCLDLEEHWTLRQATGRRRP